MTKVHRNLGAFHLIRVGTSDCILYLTISNRRCIRPGDWMAFDLADFDRNGRDRIHAPKDGCTMWNPLEAW